MTDDERVRLDKNLPMFVVDVLRHDVIEQIPSIVNMLNNHGCIGWRDCWPRDFTAQDVIRALRHLADEGYVDVLREPDSGDTVEPTTVKDLDIREERQKLWFALTEDGRRAW